MKKATKDLLLAGAALFVGSKLLKKQKQVSAYTTDLSQDKITGLGSTKNNQEISRITVISKKKTGLQVLKDSLTTTEKKILKHMLNAGLNEGQVRNKIFQISKTGNNTADVVIGTITKSITLGRNEIVKDRVKIKYS